MIILSKHIEVNLKKKRIKKRTRALRFRVMFMNNVHNIQIQNPILCNLYLSTGKGVHEFMIL